MTATGDGNIYLIGLGDQHTPNHQPAMNIVRFSSDGSGSLFANHLPTDPGEITYNPNNNDLYFTSASGVFRIFEVENTFFPLLVR